MSRLCPLAFQHLAVPGPSEPTEIVTVETSDTAGEETVIGEAGTITIDASAVSEEVDANELMIQNIQSLKTESKKR